MTPDGQVQLEKGNVEGNTGFPSRPTISIRILRDISILFLFRTYWSSKFSLVMAVFQTYQR